MFTVVDVAMIKVDWMYGTTCIEACLVGVDSYSGYSPYDGFVVVGG